MNTKMSKFHSPHYIQLLTSLLLLLFSAQMMEVQPSNSRCLRTNSSAASTSAPMAVPLSNPISRSQSMMATSSSCQAISHQHARCRQHHAAEIHHPDDGSGSVVSGNRSSPSIAARSAIGGSSTRLQPQQREWEREREMQQQPTQSANTPRQQGIYFVKPYMKFRGDETIGKYCT